MDERRFAKISIALALVARLILAPERLLSPDEAYYLCAARHPSWRWPIVDHPPLLGWILAFTDRLGGSIELRVRVVAAALQVVTALAIASTAASIKPEAFGWGAFLATWGLMSWVSGLIATPDAPLLAATACLIYFASRERPNPLPLLLLSFVAVSAKVSGLIVVVAVAASVPMVPRIAAIVGAAVAIPLARASLHAQIAHALGRGALVSAPRIGALPALLAFIAGAVLLYGPALAYLAVRGRAHLTRVAGGPALVVALTMLVVVSAIAGGRAPEPNWIAPAVVPLMIAGAIAATELRPRARRTIELVHLLPAMVAIGLWAGRDLLPAKFDPLARVPRDRDRAQAHPLPPYAAPAWSCVYDRRCDEIEAIFNTSNLK
jgi:hypothetical protein